MQVILECALGDLWTSGAAEDSGARVNDDQTFRCVRLRSWAVEVLAGACVADSWLDRIWPGRAGDLLVGELCERWGSAWRPEAGVAAELALCERGELIEEMCQRAWLSDDRYAEMVVLIGADQSACDLLEACFPSWDVFSLV
jgi:hypothetical protein